MAGNYEKILKCRIKNPRLAKEEIENKDFSKARKRFPD